MKERPILFRPDLVRAILSGRKTETRRPLSPQPELAIMPDFVRQARSAAMEVGLVPTVDDEPCWRWKGCFYEPWPRGVLPLNPFGWSRGARLWVRETWTAEYADSGEPLRIYYRADDDPTREMWDIPPGLKWRPSIHMPRWACRLVLPIVEVRIERLQSITEEGAVAEGKAASVARWWACMDYEGRSYDLCGGPPDDEERAGLAACIERTYETTARDLFAQTWSDIYGKQDGLRWADDPWVWVVRWNHADILTGEAARPEAA